MTIQEVIRNAPANARMRRVAWTSETLAFSFGFMIGSNGCTYPFTTRDLLADDWEVIPAKAEELIDNPFRSPETHYDEDMVLISNAASVPEKGEETL